MSRFTEPVWMRHDELDRTVQVVRSQVPFLGAAGWHEVDPPEPEPEPEDSKDKPSRRSRPRPSSKEND